MRAQAILMGIIALMLASCSVTPKSSFDARAELSKIKGPDTGTVQGALAAQADQAEEAGDYAKAAQIYKQVVSQSPDKIEYKVKLAENLRRANDCPDTLKVTEKILKKDPKNADAIENNALCFMTTGEFDEAGRQFGEVMKIDPKRWRTLNGIGILFAMKGKYDPAVAYYQEALNISPDNPSVLNNAALTYAIDKQFGRAYDAFERAKHHVSADSQDLKHLDLNEALVYAVDGKLDEAQALAAPHLSKAALYNNMGFYSYLSKNNALAKGYLNMALTQSPVYYERAWKNMGALTGDTSGSGESQAMPADMDSQKNTGNLDVPSHDISTSHTQAAIPLSDIPESKPIHTEDFVTPLTNTQKTGSVAQEPKKDTSANIPKAEPKPSEPTAEANPDIVLLHKPPAAQNGDWDTDKKNEVDTIPNLPTASSPAPATQ